MTGGFGGSMGGVGGASGGKAKRPISVKFEIPYFTTSGIQVRYLKIIEPKVRSGPPFHWLRWRIHPRLECSFSALRVALVPGSSLLQPATGWIEGNPRRVQPQFAPRRAFCWCFEISLLASGTPCGKMHRAGNPVAILLGLSYWVKANVMLSLAPISVTPVGSVHHSIWGYCS